MRRPSLVTIALVLPVVLGVVDNLAASTVQVPDRWKPWVWLLTVLLAVAAVGIEVRRHRSDEPSMSSGGGLGLAEAAGQLAEAVEAQWEREEERRRVHTPFPLPVRWHTAPEALMDHWANICRTPAGTTPEPLDLAGQLDQIVEVYQRIPSARLVILGRAGSGKTILALRFVLDLLNSPTDNTAGPVPVIVSLGSWNPTTISLRDWLIEQLIRDYPGLAASGPTGVNLAAALVNAGSILPVLDGFDEIADGLHRAALTALNAIRMPLLLTSRSEQYTTAVTVTTVLTDAAAIALDDLTLTDLNNYLPRTTRKTTVGSGTTTAWDPVLAHLRDQPVSLAAVNLTTVLSTPLMVVLARTIYSDPPDLPHRPPPPPTPTVRPRPRPTLAGLSRLAPEPTRHSGPRLVAAGG